MHSKQVILSVKNVKKYFVLPQFKKTSVKNAFVDIFRKNTKTRQKVLDGVSFDVYKGDFFGIVGRNGSGKSTLLKLIAGVYHPTTGSIDMRGGLTPFIELGVGFNPELSGRDNVYLNGALLGFTRKQMDKMYDEIVDFAELGPFMEQKLKNYSSGMQVRLAFSIAIKAKNDILIFDEVLAVGDEAFQRKCLDVFEEYKRTGQTVILVTHDMETVKQYCNRAMLIEDGEITKIGNPMEVADMYSDINNKLLDDETRTTYDELNAISIRAVLTKDGDTTRIYDIGDTTRLSISWQDPKNIVCGIMVDIFRLSGEHVSGFNTSREAVRLNGDTQEVEIGLSLSPGRYFMSIETRDVKDKPIEVNYRACDFIITKKWPTGKPTWSGMMPIKHEWIGKKPL